MTELMQKIEQIARERKEESVKDHEQMVPVCILFKEGEVTGLVLMDFENDEEKRRAFKSCGILCAEQGFDGAAIIVDALFHRCDKDDPEAMTQPSKLPPSQREEALVIKYTDFRDLRKNEFIMVPYEEKGDRVSFVTESTDFGGMSGQLEGCLLVGFVTEMLRESVMKGTSTDKAFQEFLKEYFQGLETLPDVQKSLSMGFF